MESFIIYEIWFSYPKSTYFVLLIVQEIEPKKKSSPQRNALASALRLQRKIIKTLNESVDELNGRRKNIWWSRWIPREE